MRALAAAPLVLAALAACERTYPRASVNLCDECPSANEYVKCDPLDGLCKCGPPGRNLVCADDEVCTPQQGDRFTCLSTRCDLVECDRGQRCEPSTGACVCGDWASAPACADTQTCENGRCTPGICEALECPLGSACDPLDGACRCGGEVCGDGVLCLDGRCRTDLDPCDPSVSPFAPICQPGESCHRGACVCAGGPACADDQRCVDGQCVPDPCHGVNCPDGMFCNGVDSLCHCGSDVGPVCAGGQICRDGACTATCEGVVCGPGEICDPNPDPRQGGFCRCGGIGPEFPRCGGAGYVCDLGGPEPRCRCSGDCCASKDCAKLLPGSSCDPDDGLCKCGGLEGLECGGEGQTGAACAVEDGENVCTTICDPLGSDCAGEDSCYYDPYKRIALCLAQGTTLPDRHCKVSSDCVAGAYCAQLQDTRVCRELCNLDAPAGEPDGCPDAKDCSPLPNPPDPRLGECLAF